MEFMNHLMWPDTTNDPWWVAYLRYAAVMFGSLWAFSLGLLTLFVFTAPAGGPMVAIFGPLMQISGALFEMAAYISTIFHLLTLSYDLHQASNAENAEELSETSDQVADDVQRGMVAYLGTAMMFMGPYIGAVLGKTPLGKWWGNFKAWFEARQIKVNNIRNGEVVPPRTSLKPNPDGDLVAGEEFIGEGTRMTEQPYEGRTTPRDAETGNTETGNVETGYTVELATRKGNLQQRVETTRGRITETEQTINQRTGEMQGEYAERLQNSTDRIQNAQREINNIEQEITSAESQSQLSRLEERLNELQQEIDIASNQITGTNGMRVETSDAISSLEKSKKDPLGEVNADPNKNHYNASRIEARNEPLLKDGEPVLREDGSPYSHIRDLQNAHDALANIRRQLEFELNEPLAGLSDHGIEILFKNANMSDTQLEKLIFGNSDFSNTNFSKSNLSGSNLSLCNLENALFQGAELKDTIFLRAKNVDLANFDNANVQDVRFLFDS